MILNDNSPRAIIKEIGNQVHNLGCEHQDDEELSTRLGDLASRLWDAAQNLPAFPEWCGDYTYRYTAVRGLERRRVTSSTYHSVTGDILAAMTADELEHIAQVMKR